MKKNPAFTLIEIIVVVVILGIISAIAIPNYTKTIISAQKKDALNNLKMIHSANQLYFSRTSSFFPTSSPANVTAINQELNINIIPGDLTYTCTGGGSAFSCTAVRSVSPTFTVTVTQAALSTANPGCSGYCP